VIKKSKQAEAVEIIDILRKVTAKLPEPMSLIIAREYHKDPFLILISCLLSLRAKDKKTLSVVRKLFSYAKTPQDFVLMSQEQLETLIYEIGFYKQKARTVRFVSNEILTRFNGKVPKNRNDLMSIRGIGPKTASLVLGMAYNIPAICVDVHVNRLSNLLGLVKTKDPSDTEVELEKIIPKEDWIEFNHLLVKLGQNLPKIFPHLPKSMQDDLSSLMGKSVKF